MSEEQKQAPLYQQVREAIRTKIEDGDYGLGEVLPSEQELSQPEEEPTVGQAAEALEPLNFDEALKEGSYQGGHASTISATDCWTPSARCRTPSARV